VTPPADTRSVADRVRASPAVAFVRRHAIDARPLRHPAYRRLLIGIGVGTFGVQFTAVAVPVQMYGLTQSSLYVGMLGLAGLGPLVVFALWGGAIADAVDRRLLLLASFGLMWLATLGLLAQSLAHVGSPGLLLVLVGAQSAGFAVSAPTRQAILPRLVRPDELAAANTLVSTVFSAAVVAGPLAAGLLLVRADVATAYGVDALAFTVTAWATWRLPSLPPGDSTTVHDGQTAAVGAGWREVRAGLAYLRTAPVLLLSFAIDIAAMVLALPRSLFPQVAAERFGAGSIGWLYAAIALGSVVAGLTSGWIGKIRRQGVALVLSVVGWGLAVAAAGLAPWLWAAVILLALGGAADLVSAVYRQTILQSYAPDGFQGRMQGIFTAVVAGGPRLGDLRAGASAAVVGPTVAWVGGGLAAAVVAIGLGLGFPALRRYVPQPRARAVPAGAGAADVADAAARRNAPADALPGVVPETAGAERD
jgi:MFS family permease